MPVECDVVSDLAIDVSLLRLLPQVMSYAQRVETSVPDGDWSLTIRLTNDATIAETHAVYFGDATPTDVISFPSGDDLSVAQGYLGDIMISVETAALNATFEGHGVEREVAFLALHGLLHLCGHTDAEAADKQWMLERQLSLLNAFEREFGMSS